MGSSSGSVPFQVSSRSEPRCSRSGPLTVPEPYTSPVRSDAPFTVMWASCCAAVQYIEENGGSATTVPLIATEMRRSKPPGTSSAASSR